MKILYAGLLYNYGKPEEGYSYEHHNIEAGLLDCQSKDMFQVDCFYPDAIMLENPDNPQRVVEEQFLEAIQSDIYDVIFHVPFNETIDLPPNVLKYAIKKGMIAIEWDCDASWRFHNFIRHRKDRYTHFITTHSSTSPWYDAEGMRVIRSQWGGSPLYSEIAKELIPNEKQEQKYDVSFVGQKHGIRPQIVDAMLNAGIELHLFGNYWDGFPNWHGYITEFSELIHIFQSSAVCINFSNPWHVGTLDQIKGRHFEIPQVGAFQLSTPADDLAKYFTPDKEIVIASSIKELIEKTKYYVNHREHRQEIAEAGYRRMQTDHQWSHRFQTIFQEIGLL